MSVSLHGPEVPLWAGGWDALGGKKRILGKGWGWNQGSRLILVQILHCLVAPLPLEASVLPSSKWDTFLDWAVGESADRFRIRAPQLELPGRGQRNQAATGVLPSLFAFET